MAQNVGYALPINELKVIFKDLQKQRLLRKPILGAVFHNSTDELAKFLSNPVPAGYYIKEVLKESLMDKMGVIPGDMLYKFNGYIIDAFGEAQVPWSQDSVLLKDLISRLSIGQSVSIVIYRNGEKKQIKFKIEPPVIYPIREVFPGYEEIDYEVIGGMVVMELVENHFEELSELNPFIVNYAKPENKIEPVLVITHVMPGSYVHQVRCLNPGDIISKVNGKMVGTLVEFRKLLKMSIKTKVFSVETTEKTLAVFDFKAMLKDEIGLAVSFAYPISEDIAKLIEEVNKSK
jgi:S1-C subfamily serine protease